MVPINSDLSLQWWPIRNRYLEAWGKAKTIIQVNDIAEIYFILDKSELCFSFHSTSGDGSDIHRFPHRK